MTRVVLSMRDVATMMGSMISKWVSVAVIGTQGQAMEYLIAVGPSKALISADKGRRAARYY